MHRNFVIGVLLATFMSACSLFTSWDDVMGTWVGSDIKRIEELWGTPLSTTIREDGSVIYKYHREMADPSCFHYWVVDQEGIIVDFYHEGYCRPSG